MDLVRIGDKIVSRRRIYQAVDKMLEMRKRGLSQAETAARLGVDRTLVSRLESLGEVRKGERIAVIGFPVANKDELTGALQKEGVDFMLLMTEEERWDFIKQRSGLELFNKIMELMSFVRGFDHIVVLGSDQRVKIMEAALGREIISHIIGSSPIQEDKFVNIEELLEIIRAVKRDKRPAYKQEEN